MSFRVSILSTQQKTMPVTSILRLNRSGMVWIWIAELTHQRTPDKRWGSSAGHRASPAKQRTALMNYTDYACSGWHYCFRVADDAVKRGCNMSWQGIVSYANCEREAFRVLWDDLYSNWHENPWVWVYKFEVVS